MNTLADVVRAAARHGNREFFSYVPDGRTEPSHMVTFADFVARSSRLAGLLHDAGVRPGTRLALIGRSDQAFGEMVAAGLLLGATVLPVNSNFRSREIARYLTSISCEYLYADSSTWAEVEIARGEVGSLRALVSSDRAAAADVCLDLDAGSGSPAPVVDLDPTTPGVMLHTSGTTGLPKAVMHTHGNYVAFLRRWDGWGVLGSDRLLCFGPYYHQQGLLHNFLAALHVGAPIRQLQSFSARTFWDHVAASRASVTGLLPPSVSYLLAQPAAPTDRTHTLRYALTGGRGDHWLAFQERFGIPLHSAYSSTETIMCSSTGRRDTSPPVSAERLGRRGYLGGGQIPGWSELRIVDEHDDGVPAETQGNIQARGVAIFHGYPNDPDADARAFTPDGWFRTGDTGYLSAAGDVYLIDRTNDLIRRSSETIAPAEIELVLLEHPAVAEAAVVAVPDPLREQEIRACIVLAPGTTASPAEIFAHCGRYLADYKVPRYLEYRDELPRTPTSKVKKSVLVEQADASRWIDRTLADPGAREVPESLNPTPREAARPPA